jgi:hypothetical protein
MKVKFTDCTELDNPILFYGIILGQDEKKDVYLLPIGRSVLPMKNRDGAKAPPSQIGAGRT